MICIDLRFPFIFCPDRGNPSNCGSLVRSFRPYNNSAGLARVVVCDVLWYITTYVNRSDFQARPLAVQCVCVSCVAENTGLVILILHKDCAQSNWQGACAHLRRCSPENVLVIMTREVHHFNPETHLADSVCWDCKIKSSLIIYSRDKPKMDTIMLRNKGDWKRKKRNFERVVLVIPRKLHYLQLLSMNFSSDHIHNIHLVLSDLYPFTKLKPELRERYFAGYSFGID